MQRVVASPALDQHLGARRRRAPHRSTAGRRRSRADSGSPISSSGSPAGDDRCALAQALQHRRRRSARRSRPSGRRRRGVCSRARASCSSYSARLTANSAARARFVGSVDGRLRRLEIVARDQAGIGQRLLARQRRAGARQAGRGAARVPPVPDRRPRARRRRRRSVPRACADRVSGASAGVSRTSSVTPRTHRVPGFELDALHAPGHRRRHHEALADARLAFLVDGDLHRAFAWRSPRPRPWSRATTRRPDGSDDRDRQQQARTLQEAHQSFADLEHGDEIQLIEAAPHQQSRHRRRTDDAQKRPAPPPARRHTAGSGTPRSRSDPTMSAASM